MRNTWIVLLSVTAGLMGTYGLANDELSNQLYSLVIYPSQARIPAIRKLLEDGADPNWQFKYADMRDVTTPLTRLLETYQGESYQETILDLFMKYGADINTRDENGQTPLMSAANPSSVRALVARGADLKAHDKRGNTAFTAQLENICRVNHYGAPQEDRSEALIELLKAGAVPQDLVDGLGSVAAVATCAWPKDDLLRAVIAKGADFDSPVRSNDSSQGDLWIGATPLMILAAGIPAISSMQILIERGANVNAHFKAEPESWLADLDGMTPLMIAALNSRRDATAVRFLLEHGADPNLKDAKGRTALIHACSHKAWNYTPSDPAYVIRALLSGGAIAKGPEGKEALRLAREWVSPEGIQALVNAGAGDQ